MGKTRLLAAVAVLLATLAVGLQDEAAAHCDTMDGPVVQDARTALAAKDVTPVLKWVKAKDEKKVRADFAKALAAQGKKGEAAEERKFFESLVRIHRAGEGAPFTGLKPAGHVEPIIALADKSLANETPDPVVSMAVSAVEKGIRERYKRVAEALKHKDESVVKGRAYVAAYVEYTHYLEAVQAAAEGHTGHHEEAPPSRHHHGNARH